MLQPRRNSLAIIPGLLLLGMLLLTGAALRAEQPGQWSLFSSPAPGYHDRNLTKLYPVGRGALRSSDGDDRRLTLEEAVELALIGSPDYNIAREAYSGTWGDLMAAWGQFTPSAFVTWGVGNSESALLFESPLDGTASWRRNTNQSAFANLNLSFSVFDSGRMYFDLRNAFFLRGARLSQLQGMGLEVANQVRAAYFDVLRQDHLLRAAREQVVQLTEQLRRARRRQELGEVTKLDVLQAQIDLQDQELLVLEYQNLGLTARMDLSQAVGGGLPENFELAEEFAVSEPGLDVESLVAEALRRHPDLRSLELQVRQQEGLLWVSRLSFLPLVKATWSLSRQASEVTWTPDNQRGMAMGISARWDLLDTFVRYRASRTVEMELHTIRYELAREQLAVERDVRVGYLELVRLYQRNLALESSRELARQSLELERRQYELGASSMVEVRQALADFTQAEADYINSIYDFQAALSELGRSVGRFVTLEEQPVPAAPEER